MHQKNFSDELDSMLTFLLDLFFPKNSLADDEGEWITEAEWNQIELIPQKTHAAMLRKEEIHHLDCLIAASGYKSTPLLKKAIHTFKYKRIPALHGFLSQMISESLAGLLMSDDDVPVLCPVPLHWTRRYQRGFNQAELLAQDLSRTQGWPMLPLLKRVRSTGHQAWRKRAERLTAVKDAFRYSGHSPVPDYVILIDDLATTGATLDECARILKNAGVKRVEALVLARG